MLLDQIIKYWSKVGMTAVKSAGVIIYNIYYGDLEKETNKWYHFFRSLLANTEHCNCKQI